MTPADLTMRRARVIPRPWGHVVLTGILGANDEHFRKAARAWFATPAGAAWLTTEQLEGRT